MAIIDDLLKLLKQRDLADIKVEEFVLGLGYSGVRLSTGNVGVCYTPKEIVTGCCNISDRAGSIAGSSALQILELSKSLDLSEAVLGVATINALSHYLIERKRVSYEIWEDSNVLEAVKLQKKDVAVMVGFIKPLMKDIEKKVSKLFILDRDSSRWGPNCLPDSAADVLLPKANVVIITGSAIINHTIDHLLNLSRKARQIAIAGPTASMLPDPFFKRGVTAMGGIKIVNPDKAMQVLAEGGGVHQLKKYCKFYVIKPR